MSAEKDDRIQITVARERKRVTTISAFVLQAAQMRTDDVLLDRDAVRLSASAAKAFAEALDLPAEINERLTGALKGPRKFSWHA